MLIVAFTLALAAQEPPAWNGPSAPPPTMLPPQAGVMPHRAYCRYGKVHLINGRFVCQRVDRRTVHP